MKLYSNEIVFRGHPDKVCDQISDALLDAYIAGDSNTRAGIEVMGGKSKIFVTGEVTSKTTVDVESVVRDVIRRIGHDPDGYEVVVNIGKQSPDIAQGVDIGGAGDNGMMFGYACNETSLLLPKAMVILQEFSRKYDELIQRGEPHLRADGKAQITGMYDDDFYLQSIKTFTICYQNDERAREETDALLIAAAEDICRRFGVPVERFIINPTGRFEKGFFDGDAGLTGRKIVVDAYQSFANVGGGAYSGKDPSKVDRSAAYKARQIAIRYLDNYLLKWCEVQLSYSIGTEEPMVIYIDSDIGTFEAPQELYEECKPRNIIKDLSLRNPIYEKTAQFGHYGDTTFSWENRTNYGCTLQSMTG